MLLTGPNGRSEFIGAWGRKAITDFKRTLRERGARVRSALCERQRSSRQASFAVSNQTSAVSAPVKNLTVDKWPSH
jgi:hypothetical protein